MREVRLTPAQHAAILRSNLARFVQAGFKELHPEINLVWAPYLDLICSRLQDVAYGRRRHLIITLPPRHLKSFCASISLPAFYLGHYPSRQVMCISYGQDLAKTFAEDTRRLMQSPFYAGLFGEVLAQKRPPFDALATSAGGIRRATSIDGVATGVGADLLIFDDPQKPGETLSEALRRSTNEAYELTFLSRRNDPSTACMVIVMQRVHEDDFVAHVLGLGGDWEVVNLPAIAEEDQEIPYDGLFGHRVFRRPMDEALHPGRVPLSELARIRQSVGEAVWATQYQQRPAPAGGGLVNTKWFKRYTAADLPPAFDRVVQSWDTANTTKEWSDYSVCTTWGVKGKGIYLLHVYRARLLYPELKRAVLEQARLHDASIVFVEDHASGTQILQDLRGEGFGKLRGIKHTRDKKIRMTNQTALIENGFVQIPSDAPWLEEYLYELAVFPNGKHDDQVDSTSQALEGISSPECGFGVFEYYRQEHETLMASPPPDETWVMQNSRGVSHVSAIDGTVYTPAADGLHRMPAKHAAALLNQSGWKRVA